MPALQDIFDIWDPLSKMAIDLELPYQTVAKWKQRGRIPSESWAAVISAAKKKGHIITFAQIADANPPRQSAGAA
jgi:hypothetical protein